jgi:hypothetical protein
MHGRNRIQLPSELRFLPTKDNDMAVFTVILETAPRITGDEFFVPPSFHSTDIIEASDIDDAWEKARQKWYIKNPLSGLEIAGIKAGQWSPPKSDSKIESDKGNGEDDEEEDEDEEEEEEEEEKEG